jgi:hypothetical protein
MEDISFKRLEHAAGASIEAVRTHDIESASSGFYVTVSA